MSSASIASWSPFCKVTSLIGTEGSSKIVISDTAVGLFGGAKGRLAGCDPPSSRGRVGLAGSGRDSCCVDAELVGLHSCSFLIVTILRGC